MPRAVTSSLYHSVRLDQWFSTVATILYSLENINETSGNSLEVLWLGLGASTAVGMVRSLLGKLRSHCRLQGAAKKQLIKPTPTPHQAPGNLCRAGKVILTCSQI